MNRAKAQGTAAERDVLRILQEAGLPASRLPEGGPADLGDLLIDGLTIVEVKARQKLSAQEALAAAARKAAAADLPAVLWWRRLVPGKGSRRQPVAGQRDVVVMPVDLAVRALVALWQADLNPHPGAPAVPGGDLGSGPDQPAGPGLGADADGDHGE